MNGLLWLFAAIAADFNQLDQNGDGFLDPQESAQIHFKQLDLNQDGRISRAEFNWHAPVTRPNENNHGRGGYGRGRGRGKGQRPLFQQFDLNGDGRILEQEFYQAMGQRIDQRYRAGYPMRHIGQLPEFKSFDRDGDGQISPQEFQSFHQSRPRMIK